MLQKRNDLLSRLKCEIETYFDKHPSTSVQSLADRAKVGYNTIRRIMNLHSLPEMTQVLKILSVVADKKTVREILDFYDESIKKVLCKAFADYDLKKDTFFSVDLDYILSNEDYMMVYTLAANWNGCTDGDIEKILGESGARTVDFLTKSGHIVRDENGRLHANNKNFSCSLDLTKKTLKTYSDYFSEKNSVEGHLYTYTQALNKNAMSELSLLQKKHMREILQLLKNQKNWGEIPVFTIGAIGAFTSEDI